MKPTTFRTGRILLAILIIALTVGLVSWGHQSPGQYEQTVNDTVPKKKITDKKVRDLDDILNELNAVDMQETMGKDRPSWDSLLGAAHGVAILQSWAHRRDLRV